MRFTIYKNSVLATLLSIFSNILLLVGVVSIFSGAIPVSIFLIAIGIGMNIWASNIADKKSFKAWVKKLKENGVEAQMAQMPAVAFAVYKANPKKDTLKYIASVNPYAASEIQRMLDEVAYMKKNK